jgi:hypothetical protein
MRPAFGARRGRGLRPAARMRASWDSPPKRRWPLGRRHRCRTSAWQVGHGTWSSGGLGLVWGPAATAWRGRGVPLAVGPDQLKGDSRWVRLASPEKQAPRSRKSWRAAQNHRASSRCEFKQPLGAMHHGEARSWTAMTFAASITVGPKWQATHAEVEATRYRRRRGRLGFASTRGPHVLRTRPRRTLRDLLRDAASCPHEEPRPIKARRRRRCCLQVVVDGTAPARPSSRLCCRVLRNPARCGLSLSPRHPSRRAWRGGARPCGSLDQMGSAVRGATSRPLAWRPSCCWSSRPFQSTPCPWRPTASAAGPATCPQGPATCMGRTRGPAPRRRAWPQSRSDSSSPIPAPDRRCAMTYTARFPQGPPGRPPPASSAT